MNKINIIIPITNKEFSLTKKTSELKSFLQNQDLQFTVIFVANKGFDAKDYKNTQQFKLVLSNLSKKNQLIPVAFEECDNGGVIVLDATESDYINSLENILSLKTKKNLVYTNIKYDTKSSFQKYIFKMFKKVYRFYLRFFGLKKDLLYKNTSQYFNEDVVQVIKSLPEKNAYLRNFDTFTGYEIKTINKSSKNPVKALELISFKDVGVKLALICTGLALLFIVATLIATNAILAIEYGMGYYFLILIVAGLVGFLSEYVLVKHIIKNRANL
jgi:hypothetical protein